MDIRIKKKLKEQVEYLVGDWEIEYDDIKGEYFNSMHEFWGVADEEFMELLDELNLKDYGLADLYTRFKAHIRAEDYVRMPQLLDRMEDRSLNLIMECFDFVYCLRKARKTVDIINEQEDQQ